MKNQHILIQVADKILSNPNILDMDDYYSISKETYCIGGLVVATRFPEAGDGNYWDFLGKQLKTSHQLVGEILDLESDQVDRLVILIKWDEPFQTGYKQAFSAQERAQIAAKYIRHFIEQHGETTMNYNQFKRTQIIKAAMDDGAKELLQQTLTKEELKNFQEYLKEFCEKTSDTEVKGITVVEENNPEEFVSDIRSSLFKSLSEQKVTEFGSFRTDFDLTQRAVCVYGLHTEGRFMLTVSIYNPDRHDQTDEIKQAEEFLEDLTKGVYFDEPLVGFGYESEYNNDDEDSSQYEKANDNPYINNGNLIFEQLKEYCGNQAKISTNMEDEEWAISFYVTNKTK